MSFVVRIAFQQPECLNTIHKPESTDTIGSPGKILSLAEGVPLQWNGQTPSSFIFPFHHNQFNDKRFSGRPPYSYQIPQS
jgi:hypothetical protein